MEVLILKMFELKLPFEFDGENIIVGEYDTGFYGIVKTIIKFDVIGGIYWIRYGSRGYPYEQEFDNIEDVLKFIDEIQ